MKPPSFSNGRRVLASSFSLLGFFGCAVGQMPSDPGSLPSFVFRAKLASVGCVPSIHGATIPQFYRDYLADFHGTIVETLESAEMRRRALDRVRALHPDLRESDVTIHVNLKKDSGIVDVQADGGGATYTRIFLDALLDEFMNFREVIRASRRDKGLSTLADDVVRREKMLKEQSDKLEAFEKSTNASLLLGEGDRLNKRVLKIRDEIDDLNKKAQALSIPSDFDKQLKRAREELARTEREAGAAASQIAAYEAMKRNYANAKQGYEEVLGLVHRSTLAEEKLSDTVTILERASAAVDER